MSTFSNDIGREGEDGGGWGGLLPDKKEMTWPKVPNWVREPDEQTWYWHWNGDDYSVPHIYSVMASLTGETKYFVSYPDSRWCRDMAGWWLKIARPNVPSRQWLKDKEPK